jgi:hypothetical protein
MTTARYSQELLCSYKPQFSFSLGLLFCSFVLVSMHLDYTADHFWWGQRALHCIVICSFYPDRRLRQTMRTTHSKKLAMPIESADRLCHSNVLTPWSRALPEKLTCPQLVKKFPTFYGIQKFITAFTRPHHLPLSWARSIQSMPHHSISWRFILILSSHLSLGLPSVFIP